MKFAMEHGMITRADINPTASGPTTQELTNPNFEAQEQAAVKDIITGKSRSAGLSPVMLLLVTAALLVGVGYLQK